MKNRNYSGQVSQEELLYTNATGSAIASGQPVAVGKRYGIAQHLIAIAAVGTLLMAGDFTLPKATTSDTWSVGDILTINSDGELVKWTATSPTHPAGWAPEATTNTATEARIVLERVTAKRLIRHVATAGEVSASNRVVVATAIGQAVRLKGPPLVRSTAGAVRVIIDLDITGSNSDTVEFTVTSLAEGDLCDLEVELASDFTTV